MSLSAWTCLMVAGVFGLYFLIGWRSTAATAKGFYVAGPEAPPFVTGMGAAAEWIGAASFISVGSFMALSGYSSSVYLIGWACGFLVLTALMAPHLARFGTYTVPDFLGDRYYSGGARVVALICVIVVCVPLLCGQFRGVGIVLGRFLQIPVEAGCVAAAVAVVVYAGIGLTRGITATQITQYVVLLLALLIPATVISQKLTGQPAALLGLGSVPLEGSRTAQSLLQALDAMNKDLGFGPFGSVWQTGHGPVEFAMLLVALTAGTAGLPHVLARFHTVPGITGARMGTAYAMLFVMMLYILIPALAGFTRYSLLESVESTPYEKAPAWLKAYEKAGLAAWMDKNGDGRIQFRPGNAFDGAPNFTDERGQYGERLLENRPGASPNELYLDPDILMLANPEIHGLSGWMTALMLTAALTAAISTAAALLVVIGAAVSHDLYFRVWNKEATDRSRILLNKVSMILAALLCAWLSASLPGSIVQVVAWAFGLAAATLFPALVMGILWKRITREGAVLGMVCGLCFTAWYVVDVELLGSARWFLGVGGAAAGAAGMVINFTVATLVSLISAGPPDEVKRMVERSRYAVPGK